MPAEHSCPRCGKPLAPDAPLGLCPACLLQAGFPTGPQTSAGSATTGRKAHFVPPKVADIARYFPQLEILELIGQGGMGAVYKARQPALDRHVALKIMPTQTADDPGFAERFSREARALARLNHPNIVSVYDFGEAGGFHYFIMEHVDGANLRQIERAGQLAPREALQIIPQICEALQFAHDGGIVHRDIKPENILLDKKGRVKIADFGLAKIFASGGDPTMLTEAGQVMGTPHYMAPEQVEHPTAVDHRADIYSLGVVFYEMLTGELPLGRFAIPSEKAPVDARLDEVVMRTLEKEPSQRYQQARVLKTDVETIAGNGDAAPSSKARPAWKYWWAAGVALALAFLIHDSAYKLQGIKTTTELTAGNLPHPAADPNSITGYEGHQHIQVMPALGTDGYHWILQTEAMLDGQTGARVRHMDDDGPPGGREVHWSGSLHWLLTGLAWTDHMLTGATMGQALEREAPWAATAPFALMILILPPLLAKRLGPVPALLLALGFVVTYPYYEFNFVGYFDHHGLAASCNLLLVLFLIAAGGGFLRNEQARLDRLMPVEKILWEWLPDQRQARRWFIASAVAGGAGMWISAASVILPMFGIGLAALVGTGWLGRTDGRKVYWSTDPMLWRTWGIAGACTSLFFYLLEYFPSHFSLRLEVNHPVYALAWLGAGDLLGRLGCLLQGRRPDNVAKECKWAGFDVAALAIPPLLILTMGERVFSIIPGSFMINLHEDYILEFRTFLQQMSHLSLLQILGGISLLPLVIGPMLALFCAPSLPRPWKGLLTMALGPALVLAAMGMIQIRWLGICCAVSIPALAVCALIIDKTRSEMPWNAFFSSVFAAVAIGVGLIGWRGPASAPWIILGSAVAIAVGVIGWSRGNKTMWIFGTTLVWAICLGVWFFTPAAIASLFGAKLPEAQSAGTAWLFSPSYQMLSDDTASITWTALKGLGLIFLLGGLAVFPTLVVGGWGVAFFKWRFTEGVRGFFVSAFLIFILMVLLPFPSFTAIQWVGTHGSPGISELDLTQVVTRDVSQRLRMRLGAEQGVIVSGPTTTTWMMYFGGFRGIGTLYWENTAGLEETAAIYSAKSDEEAYALVKKNHVTHFAIFQWDAFAEEYARLGAALPRPKNEAEHKAQTERLSQAFILRVLNEHKLPSWLRVVPYKMPDHPMLKNSYAMILEVVPPQTSREAALHTAEWYMSDGKLDAAEKQLDALLQSAPDYLPGLVNLALLQRAQKRREDFLKTMLKVGARLDQADKLSLEGRVDLAMALEASVHPILAANQVRACLAQADEAKLRHLSWDRLQYFLMSAERLQPLSVENQKTVNLGLGLLPKPMQAEVLALKMRMEALAQKQAEAAQEGVQKGG